MIKLFKCDNCGREMEIAATGQCPFCKEGNIVDTSGFVYFNKLKNRAEI